MATQLYARELKEKLGRHDTFLLDVRTPEEYSAWSIKGSVNIPASTLRESLKKIPKDKEVITICAHGIRSKAAAEMLTAMGYTAHSVLGGMAAWNSVYDTVSLNAETGYRVLQVRRLGKGCIGYLIVSNGEAAVIDPTAHIGEFVKIATQLNCRISKVLDTHQHADHVSGARVLADEAGAQLFLNPLDSYRFAGFTPLKDKYLLRVGSVDIEAIHTPGHTKGSMSFLIHDKLLITGDTLFVDGIARPDLREKSGEFAADLFSTYHDKLLSLDGSTRILPGHFNAQDELPLGTPLSALLGDVRKKIKIFDLSKSEFVKALRNVPPKPPHYEEILKINKGEAPFNEDAADELEEGPNRCVMKV